MTLVKSVPLKFVDYFRHEITPNKIDLSYPVLVANSSRTNYAFSIGNRTQELTVDLGYAASQNLEVFQENVNLTCTAGAPTSTSTVALMRHRVTHDTTNMPNLRLRMVNTYMDVQKNLQDAYGCVHGIDFYTNAVTVGGEAAVGVFNMECNSVVTGNVRGIIINLYGAGLSNASSIGLEVRSDGGAATLDEGIRIWGVGSSSITTGINFCSPTGTVNCMVVSVVPSGDDGGILKCGVEATHLTSAVAGGLVHLFVDNSATSGNNRVVRVETLSSGTSTALKNYGGRFAAGIKESVTAASGAWAIGVQGKVVSAGTMVDGCRAAAVLAQIGTGGTYNSGALLYGVWIDNQLAATPTCGGSGGSFHMLGITNTCTACVPTSFVQIHGTAECLFVCEHTGGAWLHDSAECATQQGYLKVRIDGALRYIALYLSHNA